MKGVFLCNNKESISERLEINKGLVALYGMSYWSALLIDDGIRPNYVIDRKAILVNGKPVMNINGVPVVPLDWFREINKNSSERATIIVTAFSDETKKDIHNEIWGQAIDLDVIDLFDNVDYFSNNGFRYKNDGYSFVEHSYNCGYSKTRMTERSVEVALAKRFVSEHDKIIEIGAVTPYYFFSERIQEVIDPTDIHARVKKLSLFECDLNGKDVLSISTVEHVGTSDYGMTETYSVIDAINKIRNEAKSYLITAPLGYNRVLDDWVVKNKQDKELSILVRTIGNDWRELPLSEYDSNIEYSPFCARGIIVIEKENSYRFE